jgi:hypothetical protein
VFRRSYFFRRLGQAVLVFSWSFSQLPFLELPTRPRRSWLLIPACETLHFPGELDGFRLSILHLFKFCHRSQFTPFGSAVGPKMKDVLPFGACLPLTLILILTHLNRIVYLYISIVGVHLILASPLSRLSMRVQLCVNILSLKWILLTIYSAFAPLRGCAVMKPSAISVRITPLSTDIFPSS